MELVLPDLSNKFPDNVRTLPPPTGLHLELFVMGLQDRSDPVSRQSMEKAAAAVDDATGDME